METIFKKNFSFKVLEFAQKVIPVLFVFCFIFSLSFSLDLSLSSSRSLFLLLFSLKERISVILTLFSAGSLATRHRSYPLHTQTCLPFTPSQSVAYSPRKSSSWSFLFVSFDLLHHRSRVMASLAH